MFGPRKGCAGGTNSTSKCMQLFSRGVGECNGRGMVSAWSRYEYAALWCDRVKNIPSPLLVDERILSIEISAERNLVSAEKYRIVISNNLKGKFTQETLQALDHLAELPR